VLAGTATAAIPRSSHYSFVLFLTAQDAFLPLCVPGICFCDIRSQALLTLWLCFFGRNLCLDHRLGPGCGNSFGAATVASGMARAICSVAWAISDFKTSTASLRWHAVGRIYLYKNPLGAGWTSSCLRFSLARI